MGYTGNKILRLWTIEEMKEIDRRIRKLFTTHNGLQQCSKVGLSSVEAIIHLFRNDIEQSDEKLISAVRGLYELRSESEEEYRDRVKSALTH